MTPNKKPVVLIVEDDAAGISSLVGILGASYELMVAKTLADAKRLLSAEVDVILLDLYLPDGRGIDLLQHRLGTPSCREVPVICLSVSDQTQDIEDAFRHGALDYVVKPFNPVILHAKVSTFVAFRQQAELLASQALVDPLTGVGNRRLFDQQLDVELRRAQRHGHSLSVALVDLDDFKAINDQYGHASGDDCLRVLANVMADTFCRSGDVVARLGGDEFAALLPATTINDAVNLSERFRTALAGHIEAGHGSGFTVSVGCHALLPTESSTLADLVEPADQNLYEAKRVGGRNCVRPRLQAITNPCQA